MMITGFDRVRGFLEEYLGSGRIVVAFIGSPLRRDDRAGLILYEHLSGLESGRVRLVKCEYGLENCVSEITMYRPDKLLLVDAVYVEGVEPGNILVSDPVHIREGVGIATTHNLPLSLVLETITREAGITDVKLLGIRVADTDYGVEITDKVREAVERLSNIMRELLQHNQI